MLGCVYVCEDIKECERFVSNVGDRGVEVHGCECILHHSSRAHGLWSSACGILNESLQCLEPQFAPRKGLPAFGGSFRRSNEDVHAKLQWPRQQNTHISAVIKVPCHVATGSSIWEGQSGWCALSSFGDWNMCLCRCACI